MKEVINLEIELAKKIEALKSDKNIIYGRRN